MKWRFVDLTPEEEKRLFNYEFNGPIADFSARIRIGYAMYLFGRETRDDLETIRTIRNLFAHHHEIITFNTDEIKDACGGLLIIKRKYPSALRESKGARGFYITACREIAHSIQMAVMTRTTKWNPSREGPKPPRDVP